MDDTKRPQCDLRTRIANALRNMTGPNASGDPISYEGMADAVIRELSLTREDNEADFTGPYRHRYVTDWEADDEDEIYEARKKCGYE